MTIFCDERVALTGTVWCGVRFKPGDYVNVNGKYYAFDNETTVKREADTIRIVNLKRSQRQKFPKDFRPAFHV